MKNTHKKKKILFVITKSNWGGAQKYVYDLATSFRDKHFDVAVALGGNDELALRLEENHIPVIHLKTLKNDMNMVGSIKTFFELLRVYRKESPDIIHLNSSKIGLFGGMAGLFSSARIIFTAHSWPFNEERGEMQKKILRLLMQCTVFFSDRTICNSKNTVQTLNPPEFLKRKCEIIYNGIRPISFKPSGTFFAERGIEKKEELALVSIGELHESKGFDLALNHLAKLSHLSWEWHVLGEGKERENLESLIKNLGLHNRVFLHGHVKDAPTHLTSFDVFFLPSRTEGLAYVAIEALQTNLPIIASNAGGIPEVLRRDTDTTFVTIRDPNAYITIEKALRMKSLPVTSHARDKLRIEFSLAHMVEQT
ncbi:MAG: hypothetical protein QG653_517 [Patescibacteria group bacterium]|nr:hypothetical protein [Patescibacteria group bacterium]